MTCEGMKPFFNSLNEKKKGTNWFLLHQYREKARARGREICIKKRESKATKEITSSLSRKSHKSLSFVYSRLHSTENIWIKGKSAGASAKFVFRGREEPLLVPKSWLHEKSQVPCTENSLHEKFFKSPVPKTDFMKNLEKFKIREEVGQSQKIFY